MNTDLKTNNPVNIDVDNNKERIPLNVPMVTVLIEVERFWHTIAINKIKSYDGIIVSDEIIRNVGGTNRHRIISKLPQFAKMELMRWNDMYKVNALISG